MHNAVEHVGRSALAGRQHGHSRAMLVGRVQVGVIQERLPDSERAHVLAKVTAFLNNPDLHPTAQHGPAVATLSASQRAAAYVFHGVVHAIAREQTRD